MIAFYISTCPLSISTHAVCLVSGKYTFGYDSKQNRRKKFIRKSVLAILQLIVVACEFAFYTHRIVKTVLVNEFFH